MHKTAIKKGLKHNLNNLKLNKIMSGVNEPITTAKSGFHNLDEYGLFGSMSKRDLFILLREHLLRNNTFKTWTEEAEKELKTLHKYGIK